MLAWWNFLVTPSSFSSSFLLRWSSMRASTMFVAKLSEYCARPRSGSHSELTQVWPSWAMQGYRTWPGCRCSSMARRSFFRWSGWVTPKPASNSASLNSSKTCQQGVTINWSADSYGARGKISKKHKGFDVHPDYRFQENGTLNPKKETRTSRINLTKLQDQCWSWMRGVWLTSAIASTDLAAQSTR